MLTAFITRRQPMYQLVNLAHKFSLFSEQWQPKVVAEMNDYQFKVVRIAGDFIWHRKIGMRHLPILLDL